MTQYFKRWLVRKDVTEIVSSLERFVSNKWSVDDYPKNLKNAKTIGIVFTTDCIEGPVVGSCVYRLEKHKLIIGHLVYNPEFDGVAEFIVNHLKEKIKVNRKYFNIIVHERDVKIQLDLKKCGMKCVKYKNNKLVFRMYSQEPVEQ